MAGADDRTPARVTGRTLGSCPRSAITRSSCAPGRSRLDHRCNPSKWTWAPISRRAHGSIARSRYSVSTELRLRQSTLSPSGPGPGPGCWRSAPGRPDSSDGSLRTCRGQPEAWTGSLPRDLRGGLHRAALRRRSGSAGILGIEFAMALDQTGERATASRGTATTALDSRGSRCASRRHRSSRRGRHYDPPPGNRFISCWRCFDPGGY